MAYQLWIENQAKAEIKRLPGNMRQRIQRVIRDLLVEPRPHYSRQMNTPADVQIDVELRRLRLGRWRVIYFDNVMLVLASTQKMRSNLL